jgi:hypothetical protein
MLTIFCGEDSVTARAEYLKAIEKYKSSQAEILSVATSSLLDIQRGIGESLSLFSEQKIFCMEGLEKYGFKKSTKAKKDAIYEAIVSLTASKSIIILDFEEGKQGRLLKLKDLAKISEYKPSTSIFQLMDLCVPGNKLNFISALRTVCETQDEMFVFVMLSRHLRQLVLVSQGVPLTLPPWQKGKISTQAKKWDSQKLLNFYEGIIKIEIGAKSSANPYGIAKSLEILACHYL